MGIRLVQLEGLALSAGNLAAVLYRGLTGCQHGSWAPAGAWHGVEWRGILRVASADVGEKLIKSMGGPGQLCPPFLWW